MSFSHSCLIWYNFKTLISDLQISFKSSNKNAHQPVKFTSDLILIYHHPTPNSETFPNWHILIIVSLCHIFISPSTVSSCFISLPFLDREHNRNWGTLCSPVVQIPFSQRHCETFWLSPFVDSKRNWPGFKVILLDKRLTSQSAFGTFQSLTCWYLGWLSVMHSTGYVHTMPTFILPVCLSCTLEY